MADRRLRNREYPVVQSDSGEVLTLFKGSVPDVEPFLNEINELLLILFL